MRSKVLASIPVCWIPTNWIAGFQQTRLLVFNNVEYTVRLIKGTPPIPQTLLPTAEFIADVAYATKEDVVFIFAKAWNCLEPEDFLAPLTQEARYASQSVFEELVGASAISDCLRNKMRTVRAHSLNDPNSRVRVEAGRTARGEGVGLARS